MPTGFLTSSQLPLHISKSTRSSTKIQHTLPGHSNEHYWSSLLKYVKEKFNILGNLFCLFGTFGMRIFIWSMSVFPISASVSTFLATNNRTHIVKNVENTLYLISTVVPSIWQIRYGRKEPVSKYWSLSSDGGRKPECRGSGVESDPHAVRRQRWHGIP